MEFEKHPDAEQIAESIIPQYHPHLKGVNICYLMKITPPPKKKKADNAPSKPKKKITMAYTKKVSAQTNVIGDKDYTFLIVFDYNVWQNISDAGRLALVDHELCHCGFNEEGEYLIPHDVEEFKAVIDRHGFWKSDVKNFAESVLGHDDGKVSVQPTEEAEAHEQASN